MCGFKVMGWPPGRASLCVVWMLRYRWSVRLPRPAGAACLDARGGYPHDAADVRHPARPCGRGLQGRLCRPGARVSDRGIVRRMPRRALDRGVLHEPDEGRPGDAEVL